MQLAKNILYLAHRLPYPPNKGDKIRTYHQIGYLAKRHRVWCACFMDDPAEFDHVAQLRKVCADVAIVPWKKARGMLRAVAGALRGQPLTIAAYSDTRMRRIISHWCSRVEFDAAVAFSACMAPYALQARAARRVLDLCDVDSQKWTEYAEAALPVMRRIHRVEASRLRGYEEACLGSFDAVTVITPREKCLLDPHGDRKRLHVITNGVASTESGGRKASSIGPRIGLVGAMDYPPNIEAACWFVENVWPRIRATIPLAQFVIIGRNPAAAVRRLARTKGVEVTGGVADVGQYIDGCRVLVAPLRVARGLQNKVLEAMSHRRPVIATAATAYSLQADAGWEIVVADRATDFATKTLQLLTNDSLCDQVADAGSEWVRREHNWPRVLREFERIVLGAPAPRDPLVSGSAVIAKPVRRRPLSPLASGLVAAGGARQIGRFAP